MLKKALSASLLLVMLVYLFPTLGQSQILGKMKVKGPEEKPFLIGEPKKVLLRVKTAISNLGFESTMSKELAVYQQGESTYNVYLPIGRQYVTIMAKGFQNIEIFYDFQENMSYLLEIEPEVVPEPIVIDSTKQELEQVPQQQSQLGGNKWIKHRNIGLIGTLASGIAASVFKASADKAYDSYQSATTGEDAQKYRNDTEKKDKIFGIAAGVSAVFFSYAVYSWIKKGAYSPQNRNIALGLNGDKVDVTVSFSIEWP